MFVTAQNALIVKGYSSELSIFTLQSKLTIILTNIFVQKLVENETREIIYIHTCINKYNYRNTNDSNTLDSVHTS